MPGRITTAARKPFSLFATRCMIRIRLLKCLGPRGPLMASHDTIVLDERAVAAARATELPPAAGADRVVWASQGSEVVVYLDSVDVRVRPGQVRASVDLASDDTGRVSQPVELALAYPGEPPNFAAT